MDLAGDGFTCKDEWHKKTKDNPYSQFIQNKRGRWTWTNMEEPEESELKKNKVKKNKRYQSAYEDTKKYLREILFTVK